MSGAFVCVVGPSGAGKDTLLRAAREILAADPAYLFVRRLVTRAPGSHEDHLTLSDAEFQAGVADGAFPLSWRAHGLGYAVPHSVRAAVDAGAIAICNVSRGSIADARRAFPRVATILITAPPELLTARLSQRGRETASEIQARIEREAALAEVLPDFTIANDGTAEAGAHQLVQILGDLNAASAPQGNIGTKPSPPQGQRAAT